MRLATGLAAGRTVFGPIIDDELCDIGAGGPWPTLADALGDDQRAAVDRAAAMAPRHVLADLELLPPIPQPHRILCVGLNYLEHAKESDRAPADGEYPIIFTRFISSIVGHCSPIVRPTASTSFDYEGELAVVIATPVRSLPRRRAHEAIAGYSCFMDGTLRDFQRHTTQFTAGKNFDRSGSFGPWIVTRDECDLGTTVLSTRVSGETLQSVQVSKMVHGIPELIEYCSSFTTLEPGDVIATGTPGGVGYARTPPRWLVPGDVVEVDITGIGVLSNEVVADGP